MKTYVLIMFTYLLVLAFSSWGQADRVDQLVEEQMQASHIPGVSNGVVRDGKVLLAKGYGLANLELEVPATADTVYELLSVAKQFTAAGILVLVEQGKVELNDSVIKYLPDSPAFWKDVTIQHLLTHTSGIEDYTDIPPFFEQMRLDATPHELLKPVKERPLKFAPGTRWRYSNSNYYLLGQIIEKVSGKRYEEFVEERLFQPLQMTATRINDYRDIIPHRAAGYHWLGDDADRLPDIIITGYHGKKSILQNATYISPTRKWAAGAIVSSVNDLIKWETALDTNKLFDRTTREQMWTPAVLKTGEIADYGFGNELRNLRGQRIAGHQGGGMAFNCTVYRLVDDKLAVIVLCNQTTAASRAIAAKIATFYLPDLAEPEKGIEDREPKVTALLKKVLGDAIEGKVDASLFSPGAQETVNFIRKVGPDFLHPLGPLESLTLLERRTEGSQIGYRYRGSFQKKTVVWIFALTTGGQIAGLQPADE
jgi:D-alanyl-D-alanine carboxypeptidase